MVNSLLLSRTEPAQVRLSRAVVSPAHLESSGLTGTLQKAKILIVDDEADIVASLGKRLRFAGYETVFACDGEEATRVAFKEKPDVIILDIGMPCGDGHIVAQRIRSHPNTMFAPIIFLTARVAQTDRDRAMDAGAFGYLTKPYKSELLLQMVEDALSDASF